MKGTRGRVLYIGKAGNLKKRVASYFACPYDSRIEKLVSEIKKIDHRTTDSVLEALILEAKLIKKFQPPYNIREKDDKSFLYIEITRDEFPRIMLTRGKAKNEKGEYYGPFTFASEARIALKILRKIFPFSTHPPDKIGKFKRPCLDYEIGLCPGTCIGVVSREDYRKNILSLRTVLKGKKKYLLKKLEREMKEASDKLNFERAERFKRQIFALRHIQDTALIKDENFQFSISNFQKSRRVEGYDVSNISGTSAVGAMVVFIGDKPDKEEYRQFKIKTVKKTDDVGMLKEILERRFKHDDWPLPNLVLIDGGKGQVNAAKKVLDKAGLKIPVVGIAKGLKRKKNEFVGEIPGWVDKKVLIRLRDEAHRFSQFYHKKLRSRASLS